MNKYKILKSKDGYCQLYKRTKGLKTRLLLVLGVFIPLFGLLLPTGELRVISLTVSLFSGMLLFTELMIPDYKYVKSFSSIELLHEFIAEEELKEDDEIFYL